WQAEHETSRPRVFVAFDTMVEPREYDTRSLSETGGNPNHPVSADGVLAQALLPCVRRLPCDSFEERFVVAHGLRPPLPAAASSKDTAAFGRMIAGGRRKLDLGCQRGGIAPISRNMGSGCGRSPSWPENAS